LFINCVLLNVVGAVSIKGMPE